MIYSQNITLNVLFYSFYDDVNSYYRLLANGFNEYSKEIGLNIYVELEVLTPNTATSVIENYGTFVDSYLVKKSQKYDIYFYYSNYSKKYGEHFLNLREYLPKEYINGFDKRLLEETCSSYDNKLISLPLFLYVCVLFSNQDLLSKYNKNVPETWDELINISRYIYEEEKKLNNTIIRYNGLFNDYSGAMSLYEVIGSFRESNSSPQPEITSKTTIEALKMIKEMKNEIGEDIFRAPDDITMNSLFFTGEALFLRYFYNFHLPVYKASALPGRKKGVSGTIVIPNNFAVNNYIDEERKLAAIEFMKFMALKETQKKYIINNSMFSGIMELYDDEEVCSVIECDIIKNVYPFSFMSNDVNLFGDDNYHIKYRNNMYEYLYNNKPIIDVLKKIEDITRIYTFSLKTDETIAGLIIFIILLMLSTSMILSLIFLFIKKIENRFKFLPKGLWVITTLGSLILMSSIITLYDDVSNVKCHLRVTLINVGFILSICPSLNKLIMNFPEHYKISMWFKNNKYISILIIMIFTLSLNGIFAISSYDIKDITTADEKKYEKCIMNKKFGNFIYCFIQCHESFVVLVSLILIFMEWNLKETSLDVKYIATTLFIDILSLILLIIIDKVKFKEHVIYSTLLAITILIFSGSNHLFIYFLRILPMFGNNAKYIDSKKSIKKESNSVQNGTKEPSTLSSFFHNALNKNTENGTSIKTTSSSISKLNEITKKNY